MLATVQREVSVRLVQGFARVHEPVRMEHVVVAEDALQGTVDGRGVEYLLQLGDPGQHVVAHVELTRVVPLDLVVDVPMDLGLEAAIEHEHAVADEPPNLLVVQPDARGLHPVFLPSPAESACAPARILCTRRAAIGVAGQGPELKHGNRVGP